MSKYTLTCNEEQLRLIAESLEMHSRMICGQIEETFLPPIRNRVFQMIVKKEDNFQDKREEINQSLKKIKSILWPDLNENSNYGIGYDDRADLGYEMYKEILHQFEKEYKEECDKNGKDYFWNVHSSPNTLKLTDKPLIKLEKKDE